MGLRTQLCRKILPYAIKKGYGEEMLEMVQALQKAKKTELFAHDMVYHPMKTNSTFYLPYAVTDWIQRKIFVTDNYFEYKNLNYIFRTFRGGAIAEAVQNRTILDIGANIGNHTCYFMNEIKKNDASGKCICFEVMPSTAELLKKISLSTIWKNELWSIHLVLAIKKCMHRRYTMISGISAEIPLQRIGKAI